MKITWYGRACFQLAAGDGTTLICDPYHPAVGYEPHPQNPTAVTISHEHLDHNWLGWLEGDFQVFRGPGRHAVGSVVATGIATFHDDERGAARGENTVFIIEMDGIKICHLGDLGHEPSPELYEKLKGVDVLMIPVGGFFTIDHAMAAAIAGRIGARLTLPMHYSTGVAETPISGVESFAALTGAVPVGSSEIEFNRGYSGPAVAILEYKRERA